MIISINPSAFPIPADANTIIAPTPAETQAPTIGMNAICVTDRFLEKRYTDVICCFLYGTGNSNTMVAQLCQHHTRKWMRCDDHICGVLGKVFTKHTGGLAGEPIHW